MSLRSTSVYSRLTSGYSEGYRLSVVPQASGAPEAVSTSSAWVITTEPTPLASASNEFCSLGSIPLATTPVLTSSPNSSFLIRLITELSSLMSFSTPFFSKQYTSLVSPFLDSATAMAEAMVSALQLSRLPLPSCTIAENTGTRRRAAA